jgi:hypothetical protein
MERPATGGKRRPVGISFALRAFDVASDGIYFIGPPEWATGMSLFGGSDLLIPSAPTDEIKRPSGTRGYAAIQFYDFATKSVHEVHRVRTRLGIGRGLSISPDRKKFLYSADESTGWDLMLFAQPRGTLAHDGAQLRDNYPRRQLCRSPAAPPICSTPRRPRRRMARGSAISTVWARTARERRACCRRWPRSVQPGEGGAMTERAGTGLRPRTTRRHSLLGQLAYYSSEAGTKGQADRGLRAGFDDPAHSGGAQQPL